MKKRLIGVFLSTTIALSALSTFGVSAAENENEIPQSLPAKVDLRDYNGKNYVTRAKLQSPFGTCWAFGAAAAAETSYLFANDLGVPAGEENKNVDFIYRGTFITALPKLT
ncbi:MAG: C1 family peptidase [Ruminococcus sp.]|nr:C1 family peptidase [Ruminococcus sp.]